VLWNKVDFGCEAGLLDGFGGCGADGGDALGLRGELEGAGSVHVRLDGVGAGEEEPVEAADGGQGCVQGAPGTRRREFDGGDEDGDCALLRQEVGEGRSLSAGAGDEDAAALEWRIHLELV
jgi:hypothetical protein